MKTDNNNTPSETKAAQNEAQRAASAPEVSGADQDAIVPGDGLQKHDIRQSLEEILEPLVELLEEKYDDSEYKEPCMTIDFTGGQMYRVRSPYPYGVLIEMPGGLYECTPLASAVAALLKRSGSDHLWFDDAEGEDDPYRTPLRFSIVKKTICMPSDFGFSQGDHLMVDAIEFDAVAAARQVELLVEYLKDPANLVVLTDRDAWMF